jgi:HK97 family phage portal protein
VKLKNVLGWLGFTNYGSGDFGSYGGGFVRPWTRRERSLSDGSQEPREIPVTESTALSLSAVWGCVNLLAGTIGSLPMELHKGSDATQKKAKDHPLYRILHDSPNFDQTALDFWEYVAAAVELRGNFFARVERSGAAVSALFPVYELVNVILASDGSRRYQWSELGQSFDLPSEQMLHIRGFGGHPLGGMSTLAFARHTFGLSLNINEAAGETFRNGLRPSGTLSFEKFLTPEQRDIIETKLLEKFAGAMRAGRPMVLEGGTSWQQLTINPEDAQMLESRAFSIEEICRFFGVPPFMVGHTEKSTSWGTGLEQQTLAFLKFTLRRRLRRIEQAVNKQLLTTRDRAAGIKSRFDVDALLRGDSAGRAAFYQSGLTNGWMTINEVRAKENLPPVEGGDTPRMQMQNVPITQAVGHTPLAPPVPAAAS